VGKSFVLRDNSGRAVGYIQQVGNALRCGIHEVDGDALVDLFLVYVNGEVSAKRINAMRPEHEWQEEAAIYGGCVVMEGKILADTGREAKCSVKKHLQPNTDVGNREKRPERVRHEQDDQQKAARIPQRRWPPNPCDPASAGDTEASYLR